MPDAPRPDAPRPDAARRVELLTVGDELLLGFTLDTNGPFLARELAARGIAVAHRASVGDDAADVARAVREALDRTGAVIVTGGLGPTSDDRTREAVAEVFGTTLALDAAIADGLRALWQSRGYPGDLPAANLQQAMVPVGATVLTNRHGSAPGLWLEDARGRWAALLPGVPREMRGMWHDTLAPRLAARDGEGGGVVLSRTLRTTGIAESKLADDLGPLARGVDGLPLAYLPGWEGVDLRVTVHGLAADAARERLQGAVAALASRCEAFVYGEGDADLADVVLQACRGRGLTVAVAESCTGGLLGGRLTAIPGASDTVLGGVIAYDNAVKRELLGVPDDLLRTHGAVSEPVAVAMARGARDRLAADVGIAITGIAGPGGGTADKPVGTVWTAVDVRGESRTAMRRLPGDRPEIRQRAAQMALDLLRRTLADAR